MTQRLVIRLFGPPAVTLSGTPLPRLKTRKGLWLLALLALRHERDVERDWLAGTLWPETDESQSLLYLRQALTDLRKALGPASRCITATSTRTLRLDLTDVDVDVARFDEAVRRGDLASLSSAVALYGGTLLEGCTEEWVLTDRAVREQAFLSAVERLAAAALEAGDSAGAVRYLRGLIAREPLRESAYRALMQALAASRDYAAVTETYRCLRLLLRSELGQDPEPATKALFQQLRTEGREETAYAVARIRPPGTIPTPPAASTTSSLPAPLTEFIGREQELEMVRRAFADARLVTLTGTGGVGKTRLALRAADDPDLFPDGAYFVDLAPLTDSGLIARTVAAAAGIMEELGLRSVEALAESIRGRRILLILDNCEHLLQACAETAAVLLLQCPDLRILATSRERLGITGEVERRVPPLALPYVDEAPGVSVELPRMLLANESVTLFLDRARRVRPDLPISPDSLMAVARICRRLDGIPLAIELAAARASALSVDQIAERLEARFRLLSSGDRTVHPRQQTLRGLLDWSYDLLTEVERALLRRLSVFQGGWSLAAAESVCPDTDPDQEEVLVALTRLVDQSMAVTGGAGGAFRYSMLETVRHYALEKLQSSGEEKQVRRRHLHFFLRLAQTAEADLHGPEQARWMRVVEEEHDNMRAALDYCLDEPGQVRIGMQLACALQHFWFVRGHLHEGRSRFVTLLAADHDPEGSQERAEALLGAGSMAYRQSDYPTAEQFFREALVISERLADARIQGRTHASLGHLDYFRGQYDAARRCYERSLDLQIAAGIRPGVGVAFHGLGNVAFRQGRLSDAEQHFHQALAVSRELGDRGMEAMFVTSLGLLMERRGALEEARELFSRALEIHRAIGDRTQRIVNLNNLANTARKLGDNEAALTLYREGLQESRALGRSRNARALAYLLEGIGFPLMASDEPERAARALAAADVLRERLGTPRTEQDAEELETLRERLASRLSFSAEENYAIGREMSLDDLFDDLLSARYSP